MMPRSLRWTVRISLGIVAFLVFTCAALLIADPRGMLAVARVMVTTWFSNQRPPLIAQRALDRDERDGDVIDRKLTNALEGEFPVGTPEPVLRSALLKQGFEPSALPPTDCVVREISQRHIIESHCRTYDPGKQLVYARGNAVVGRMNIITVSWTTDDDAKIRGIDADFRALWVH